MGRGLIGVIIDWEAITMEKQAILKMMEDLCNAKGISGFEDEVVAEVRRFGEGLGQFQEDSLRDLIIYRAENKGGRPMVQLDAHTDEVGFMVQAIRPNGTLQFIKIGNWVSSNIPAHRVWVQNSLGEYIPGIVASKPPHFMSDAEKKAPLDVNSLVIDIGASSLKEAVEDYHIRIGAPVVPDVTFEYVDQHDLIISKALDNRLGCASIIATLDALKGEELAVDIAGAFDCQEEVGARGAVVTANTIKPDIAIVFEGCPADDTFSPEYAIQTALKKGPMLRHIDARMITNPRFQRYALDLCEELSIPVQTAVRSGGSTNGASIHLSNQGVPTIVIGIPVRYAHTHYGISSYADWENGVKLAVAILKRLNADVIASF